MKLKIKQVQITCCDARSFNGLCRMQRYYCVKSLSPRWLALSLSLVIRRMHEVCPVWGAETGGVADKRPRSRPADHRPHSVYRVLQARLHNRPFAGEEGGVYFFILFFILLIDKAKLNSLEEICLSNQRVFSLFFSFCLLFGLIL